MNCTKCGKLLTDGVLKDGLPYHKKCLQELKAKNTPVNRLKNAFAFLKCYSHTDELICDMMKEIDKILNSSFVAFYGNDDGEMYTRYYESLDNLKQGWEDTVSDCNGWSLDKVFKKVNEDGEFKELDFEEVHYLKFKL
jgi:hypothetical protein